MIPNSIRWRLPLNYAGIALLATFSLGLILLVALRGYYTRQEQAYIQSVAEETGNKLPPFFDTSIPKGALVSQIRGVAFLTQARIRVLDSEDRLLADSSDTLPPGSQASVSVLVEAEGATQIFRLASEGDSTNVSYRSEILFGEDDNRLRLILDEQINSSGAIQAADLPITTPFNWLAGAGGARSEQRTRWAVHSLVDNRLLGYVEVSEGPAYGRLILTRVAWGWALASLLATLLAVAVGWRISSYLSRPILHLTAAAQRMRQGDFSARAGVNRQDELGQLGATFNEMAIRIEETVQALRRFVSDAAHQLQTPLTVLHSDLDLIRSGEINDDQIDRLERAKSQIIRLEELTAGLLDLSRVEGASEEHRTVSLNQVVADASELYASRAEQAGLVFTLQIPPEDIIVQGNEIQLRQVVENILDNAIKFNRDQGKVAVELHTEADIAMLIVRDSGVGIPPDELPYLFSRFHRAGNAADIPGSGLGLAIVKAVVEKHGGRISLQSGAEGTEAIVRIPLDHGW